MPDNEYNLPSSADYGRLLEPLLGQAGGYALSILRNRAEAEDAVQQAALRGLERIGTFDTNRSFKGWWFAILRNCCLDVLRRQRAGRTTSIDGNEPACDSRDCRTWEELTEAMGRLSRDHCEILRLRYFGGLSYRELASALEIPEGTVMSRLHLARKALAEQICKEDV